MNYLVIYPGRFHPFHLGHKASYDYLTQKYGEDAVYIATSGVQDAETSPFDYSDKVKMMTELGVPASHIVKVKNPYQATEIVNKLSDEEKANTALIFAVSAKDAERFNFAPKKNGDPAYLQPVPNNTKKLQPLTQHGYVAITPTVNFRVKGRDADSASAVRKLYRDGNEHDRNQIITDLYGRPDPELRDIFDKRLGAPGEPVLTYGTEIVDGGDSPPVQALHERREILLKKINEMREQLSAFRRLNVNLDYIDEKNYRKKKSAPV